MAGYFADCSSASVKSNWTPGKTISRGPLHGRELFFPDLGRGLVPMALDQPVVVVEILELEQCEAELLDGSTGVHPQEILLQRPDEPLCAPVAFRLPDKRRGAFHAEEPDLGLKVI